MPPNSSLEPKPKVKSTKGKPLGIPTWGWVAALVVGVLLGYILLKRSSNASAASAPVATGSSQGSTGTDNSSVTPPSPPDLLALLQALGLVGGGTGTVASNNGSSTEGNGVGSAVTASDPSVATPVAQKLGSDNFSGINPALTQPTSQPTPTAAGTNSPIQGGHGVQF
jgi:hypothetical protein